VEIRATGQSKETAYRLHLCFALWTSSRLRQGPMLFALVLISGERHIAFNAYWGSSRVKQRGVERPEFDDSKWRHVHLPHSPVFHTLPAGWTNTNHARTHSPVGTWGTQSESYFSFTSQHRELVQDFDKAFAALLNVHRLS